jgi:hypothetical protein
MQNNLTIASFALVALLAVLWQVRVRSKRRLRAVLDAYAEREMTRADHAHGPIISAHWQLARGRRLNGESEEAKKTYSRRNLHARPQSQNR